MKKKLLDFLLLSILITVILGPVTLYGKVVDSKYKIAYSSTITGAGDIYLSDLTGKKKLKITSHPLQDGYPDCSPDGKTLVFYSYPDNHKTWSIFTMKIDGSNRKRLTLKKNVYDGRPDWSPDGTKILFSRSYKNNLEVWIMNADGSDMHRIKNLTGLMASFISNQRIIFSTNWKDDGEICLANIDGSNLVQLTRNRAADTIPQISPDGGKIAFTSNRSGNKDIYIMDLDGENQTRLTNNTASDAGPQWSPDGKKILFISNRTGNYNVFVMNMDGTATKNVSNNKHRNIQATWLK